MMELIGAPGLQQHPRRHVPRPVSPVGLQVPGVVGYVAGRWPEPEAVAIQPGARIDSRRVLEGCHVEVPRLHVALHTCPPPASDPLHVG